ncbi:MAG: hypothetical protein ACI9VR_001159 [Cognaticolwellia sp.]|jgi:hypothetical protein
MIDLVQLNEQANLAEQHGENYAAGAAWLRTLAPTVAALSSEALSEAASTAIQEDSDLIGQIFLLGSLSGESGRLALAQMFRPHVGATGRVGEDLTMHLGTLEWKNWATDAASGGPPLSPADWSLLELLARAQLGMEGEFDPELVWFLANGPHAQQVKDLVDTVEYAEFLTEVGANFSPV